MNTNIRFIIFDLGNVVIRCSFDHTLHYWAEISGQSLESIRLNLDLNTDPVHDLFEKNAIDEDEFRSHISEKIGYPLGQQEFETGWNSIYEGMIPGVEDLLEEMKKSYRIIALTNTNAVHARLWQPLFGPHLTHFEKVFSSHEIQCRKPEAEAFQLCLDYLNAKPEQTLFLDDRADYLEGAAKLGIHCLQVSSYEQMLVEMKQKGIAIG